jgi:hypothetical protein
MLVAIIREYSTMPVEARSRIFYLMLGNLGIRHVCTVRTAILCSLLVVASYIDEKLLFFFSAPPKKCPGTRLLFCVLPASRHGGAKITGI